MSQFADVGTAGVSASSGHISSSVLIDKCILILQSNCNNWWGYPANPVFHMIFFFIWFIIIFPVMLQYLHVSTTLRSCLKKIFDLNNTHNAEHRDT